MLNETPITQLSKRRTQALLAHRYNPFIPQGRTAGLVVNGTCDACKRRLIWVLDRLCLDCWRKDVR